jgi:hypothetical protein
MASAQADGGAAVSAEEGAGAAGWNSRLAESAGRPNQALANQVSEAKPIALLLLTGILKCSAPRQRPMRTRSRRVNAVATITESKLVWWVRRPRPCDLKYDVDRRNPPWASTVGYGGSNAAIR